jgi:hypothetical protein
VLHNTRPRHALRLLDRQRLTDRTAGRQADDMSALDAERIHEACKLSGHLIDREHALALVALPRTALGRTNYPVFRREGGDLRLPVARDAVESADKDERVAIARNFIVNLPVSDGYLGIRSFPRIHVSRILRAKPDAVFWTPRKKQSHRQPGRSTKGGVMRNRNWIILATSVACVPYAVHAQQSVFDTAQYHV